jgi:hypothetical protein
MVRKEYTLPWKKARRLELNIERRGNDSRAENAKATSCHSNFESKTRTQGDSDRVSKIRLLNFKEPECGLKGNSQAVRSAERRQSALPGEE